MALRNRQAIRAAPNDDPGPPVTGPSSGAGGAVTTCTCRCAVKVSEALQPQCQTRCQAVWQTCESPESQALLDTQLAEYAALLSGSGMPQATQDTMLESFKQVPPAYRESMLEATRNSLNSLNSN